LFEQMLGRATRLCPDPYGPGLDKSRFQIFDAVNIYEQLQNVSEMRPVVTRPNITFEQLVQELTDVEDDQFRADVKDQLLAKLQRRKLKPSQAEELVAATGMNQQQLIDHVRKHSPQSLADWLSPRSAVVDILDDIRRVGTKFIVSDHRDEYLRTERGYGKATKPEDYLESFRNYITQHVDELPALIVVTQRPCDLTRTQLRELRLHLDQAGFTEANLRTAVRETTNQDIAATIVGYIRHVALGQPLIAHSDRVRAAMQKIMASRPWNEPQRKWLERIGKQLEQEVVVDREALDRGQFKAQGGFQRMNKVFGGDLENILQEIADAMWQVAA
jgi:type I restriction enzyme R subunit